MRVLVTGASGGLGRRLLPSLCELAGLQVRALEHRTPVAHHGCEIVRGALDDPSSLRRATRGIDTVLHLAAVTSTNQPGRYHAVNHEGTRRVIAACADSGVRRLIYVSSSAAHPQGGGYAASKWAAEGLVAASGLDRLVLRPTEVYGAGLGEGIDQLIRWVRRWPVLPVIGDGLYPICPVALPDVTEALVRCVTGESLPARRALILGGPETMTFEELIERLKRFYGVRLSKLHLPLRLARAGLAVFSRLSPATFARDRLSRLLTDKDYDIGPTTELLDYRPRPLEQGLDLLSADLD